MAVTVLGAKSTCTTSFSPCLFTDPLVCAALVDLDVEIPHVYVCLISGFVL